MSDDERVVCPRCGQRNLLPETRAGGKRAYPTHGPAKSGALVCPASGKPTPYQPKAR